MPYSDDLRQKLLHAVDTHTLSKNELTALFDVSRSFLNRVLRRRAQTGPTQSLPHGGGARPKLTLAQQEALRAPLAAHPALLLRELVAWLSEQHQVSLSVSALCRLLQRLDLPRKKGCGTPPNATRPRISSSVPSGVPQPPRWIPRS